jgi:hypothetical protein
MKHWDFEKVAELHGSTVNGFAMVDSPDWDWVAKRVETVEVARRPELPYVFGLRNSVTYELAGNDFVEVARVEGWNEDDLARIRSGTDATNAGA